MAGAPAQFYTGASSTSFEGDYNDSLYPYRSWPSKTRFPYEMQVVAGATFKVRDNGATTGLVQHSNGGGYRASSVSVPTTVYIWSECAKCLVAPSAARRVLKIMPSFRRAQ
ncbi:MAG: hypothetical protein QM813_28465 [Verrucomicrobiota bacterium]